MTSPKAIRTSIIAAAAALLLFSIAPAAMADHTSNIILGQNCPDGSGGHACNSGTGSSECRLKNDTGKFVCTDTSTASGAVTGTPSAGGTAPLLSIPIPNLRFSDIITTKSGDTTTLTIPYLAEYIQAVYKFAIGIASVVAAIMMMVGGFRWLTAGGDSGRITAAKENIKNALVGLVLTLGGYSLLYVVNSDLTVLKGLDIIMVQKISYETEELQYTTANTAQDLAPGQIAGSHTNPFTTCPMNLTAAPSAAGAPETNARAIQFFEQIGTVATASTVAERVVQISDATAVCQVYFGSCGRTAGTLYTLAGLGSYGTSGGRLAAGGACLTASGGCWTHEKARQVKSYSGTQIHKLWTYKCDNGCNAADKPPNQEGCQTDRMAAVRKVRDDMAEEIGGGYPSAWAELLQPGDTIWVYNGWAPCSGLHSQVFLGWGAGGKAQMVDGTAGRNAHATSACLGSACGDNQYPIVKIFRP